MGLLLGVVLVALAVVTVRDLAVAQGWALGEPWLPAAVRSLDGLEPGVGVLAVATVLGVLGLLLVLAGLFPAPRRHVRADAADQLWSTPAAVAAVARAAADRSPGVLSARTVRSGKRRTVLEVVTRDHGPGSADSGVVSTARDAAGTAGGALGARRVDVRTAEEE